MKFNHKFVATQIKLTKKLSKELEPKEKEGEKKPESFFEWSKSIGLTFEPTVKIDQSLDMSSEIKIANDCKNNKISFTAI